MEASFGPTFSAVAAGAKGDTLNSLLFLNALSLAAFLSFFCLIVLYYFTILACEPAFTYFQQKGPAPTSSTEEPPPPPVL